MNESRGRIGIISALIAVASLAFGAGATWGESRCMPEMYRLRDTFTAEIRRVDDRLDEHNRLPFHPGAASNDAIQQLQERVRRLEAMVDARSGVRR